MSNSSPDPLQARKAAQPVERPLSYTEEIEPTRLSEAEKYFALCIPKAFLVSEGVYSPKRSEGLTKGEQLNGYYLLWLRLDGAIRPLSLVKLKAASFLAK